MNKIIVEIKCPALMESFDFKISKKLNVCEGIFKILEELKNYVRSENQFSEPDKLVLFSKNNSNVLNKEMTFEENGICSGDILMII